MATCTYTFARRRRLPVDSPTPKNQFPAKNTIMVMNAHTTTSNPSLEIKSRPIKNLEIINARDIPAKISNLSNLNFLAPQGLYQIILDTRKHTFVNLRQETTKV